MSSYYRLIFALSYLFFTTEVSAKTDKYRVMWRDDPATTMVIGWNQISGNAVDVHFDTRDYGKDVLSYKYSAEPSITNTAKGMNNYFVRLHNLIPNTTYYFVIKDSEGCSERMSFQTAPDNPYERLSIIAGGDSRNYREARQRANSIVAKLRPHCIMFGGDMTGGDNAVQWKAWFDDWQKTISEDGRLTPIIVTRGNHEYSNQTLIDLFDVATPEVYYALSLGGNLLKIYTLNSLMPSGGNQKKWLENDLRASQDFIWKAAQYHHAIRPHTAKAAEKNNQLNDWATLFEKYQVNLAVESDAHCVKWTYPIRPSREKGSDEGYIRDDERGTVYIGEGCWGAPLRVNNDNKSWTRNSGSFNQFKWVFIDQDRIEIRTIKTDGADRVCTVDPKDIFSIPDGLDLWKPSNGEVLVIEKQKRLLASNAYAKFVSYTPEAAEMMVSNFDVDQKEEGVIIKWNTINEIDINRSFEIQRSTNGLHYETVAALNSKGKGNHAYDYFELRQDYFSKYISYRLKESFGNNRYQIIETKTIENKFADVLQKMNKLTPNTNNGMISAKYVVDQPADVAIRLIDRKENVIARSDYKKLNSGNYLQSIDMKNFPGGQYLLSIQVNQEVVQQYLVVK